MQRSARSGLQVNRPLGARPLIVSLGMSNMGSKDKFLLLWLFLPAISVQAQLFSSDVTTIQFVSPDVAEGVTWSPSFSLTDGGLFSGKLPPNRSAEVWIQSQPISAGMSWRPPTSATISLAVEAGAEDFTYL